MRTVRTAFLLRNVILLCFRSITGLFLRLVAAAPGFLAFRKVILPEIMPGVINGLLIAFTMSIDDFVISYFTAGSTFSTLSMVIYSMAKKRVSPEINALSAIMFVVILTIILAVNAVDSAKERRLRRAARAEEGRR